LLFNFGKKPDFKRKIFSNDRKQKDWFVIRVQNKSE
jgi:hypothetical protein